jgi:hypothetical protein
VTYYFSDCQTGAAVGCVPGNNANAGTQISPKRDLTGLNLDNLAGGSRLLFARGGAFNWPMILLDNMNTSAAQPLTFDAYGSGALPILDAPDSGVYFGGWMNTSNDGGYVFRNLRLQGRGANASVGFFFVHNVHDVVIENMQITGFYLGMQSQTIPPYGVTNVLIRNNSIGRNSGMGILGQFSDTVIEDNLFEANNFSGSGFDHGTYLSGNASSGRNITLRNNRYVRNSVVNGECRGGNMTFHGQFDGLLIEGNTIVQDTALAGCWLMSITQGYTTAEWFRNTVVRNNKLINGGNTAIVVQSAPGILLEGNIIINTQTTPQTAISVGSNEYQNGDVADGNAVIRNNTACYPTPHMNSGATRVLAPNSTVTNNVLLAGAAGRSGVCVP